MTDGGVLDPGRNGMLDGLPLRDSTGFFHFGEWEVWVLSKHMNGNDDWTTAVISHMGCKNGAFEPDTPACPDCHEPLPEKLQLWLSWMRL